MTILSLWLCVLSSLSYGGSPEADLQEVLNQEAIRIGISSSYGNGHQSVSSVAVEGLRDLGFSGWIEVVYKESNRPKLPYLFSAFKDTASDVVVDEVNKIKFIPYGLFKSNQNSNYKALPFGLLGADDFEVTPMDLNTRVLLILQPYQWSKPTQIWLRNERGSLTRKSAFDMKSFGFRFRSRTNEKNLLDFLQVHTANKNAKNAGIPSLRQILIQVRSIDLAPIYGHKVGGATITKQELTYAAALSYAVKENPTLFSKPIILPVFSEVPLVNQKASEIEIRSIEGTHRISVLNASDAQAPEKIRDLKAGEILILYVGHVARPVFELFYQLSTLPVVVKGLNSINLAEAFGLTYLPSHRQEGFMFSEPPPMAAQAYEVLLKQISISSISVRGALDPLVKFFAAAKTGEADVVSAFTKNKNRFQSPSQDRLLLGLREAGRYLHVAPSGQMQMACSQALIEMLLNHKNRSNQLE